jgi:hypothetical protein
LKSRCKCKSKKDRLNPARHPHSKYILMILHSNPPISSVARSNGFIVDITLSALEHKSLLLLHNCFPWRFQARAQLECSISFLSRVVA